MVLKQLLLFHGQVGDFTDVGDIVSPTMRQLIMDAVYSCCSDIVGHFGLIRNEFWKFIKIKIVIFSFNTFDVSQIFRQ